MEIIILWIIIGIVWPMIKKSVEQGNKNKGGFKQYTTQERTVQERKNLERNIHENTQKAFDESRKKEKPQGFFEILKEELEKLEQEERLKNQQQTANTQSKKQKPPVQKKKPASLHEEKRVRQEKEAQEKRRLAQQLQMQLSEMTSREGAGRDLTKGQDLTRPQDANYAVYQKETFSVEDLEKRFSNPAQRMIVYSEILGKPKALR